MLMLMLLPMRMPMLVFPVPRPTDRLTLFPCHLCLARARPHSRAAARINESIKAREREHESASLYVRFPRQLRWNRAKLECRNLLMEEVCLCVCVGRRR